MPSRNLIASMPCHTTHIFKAQKAKKQIQMPPGIGAAAGKAIFAMHISHLRKKLEGGDELIKTIRGVGYQFARTPEEAQAVEERRTT